MTEFLADASTEVVELLRETAEEMVAMFGISKAEAVARINAQWEEQDFLERSDIVLHEDDYYWALFIYFDGNVPDWRADADRSSWSVRPAPPRDSVCWTLAEA
ncbi:hypothetical protein ACIPW9_36885 [Streptomyces sp. NPDC090052]|uniref:hypothetical protein n=1 Tax=Streptomyces sp. NPDC090052 TaxID=3365931 RepID=UPI0037FF0B5E